MDENNIIIKGVQAEINHQLENIPGYTFLKSVSSNLQIIKKQRAEEFLEFMKQNEQYFVVELINNECFVSGLALTLRQVIEQYSKYKRSRIYNIFVGFTNSNDKEDFELEKIYNTLNLISIQDLEKLRNFKPFTADGYNSEEEDVSGLISLGCVKIEIEYSQVDLKIRHIDDDPNYEVFQKINDGLADNIPNELAIGFKLTQFGKIFKRFVFSE